MEFLTVGEAAAKLRMSPAWIRMKIFKKEICFMKIGRRVFIPESTITEIIDQSFVRPHNGLKSGEVKGHEPFK